MYIQEAKLKPEEAREGVWREPWNSYWEAWLIYDNVVYDLGRYGNGAEAGIAYAKARLAFVEDSREASGVTTSHQSSACDVEHCHRTGSELRTVGLYD